MSRYHQREFIAQRVVFANSDLNIKQNQYFLEPLQILRYYLTAGFLPIRPSCNMHVLKPVCRRFFQWMLACSHNKIDQPTIQGPYSIEMSECIKKWLKAFASFHMYDPAQPFIVLSVGTHYQVYEN